LVTRGLAEMSRIGAALGAQPLTFMGLTGLGDLVLTTTGDLSRNRQVGLGLGRGKSLKDVTREIGMVAEGVKTAFAVQKLAQSLQVSAPITDAVCAILDGSLKPEDAVIQLMTRGLRME
ncbi:MAG: glycerol-3-phosphate dehydrogenase, partial [Desulfovibrio sp.]|nr:glycerol-3-phosphate dehydrogenase [Desulfovibrio sp.]